MDVTKKQYATYLRQWQEHCSEQKINPFSTTAWQGINFLGDYTKSRNFHAVPWTLPGQLYPLSYSHLKVPRLEIIHLCAGYFVAPLLQDRLYHATRVYGMWLLCKEPKNASSQLSLRELSLKLTMLIALLSGQRCQTIHALDINSMKVENHPTQQYVFQINQLLKTSRPEKHSSHLVLQSYPDRKQLCVVKFFRLT